MARPVYQETKSVENDKTLVLVLFWTYMHMSNNIRNDVYRDTALRYAHPY